jgi:hypothetical protein
VAKLLGLVFSVARGFAPAVVVAQGVRLVAGLVSQKRSTPGEGKVSEGNDGEQRQGGQGKLDSKQTQTQGRMPGGCMQQVHGL